MICEEMGCAQTAGGTGFILCLCGAVSAPLCRGDWPVISPSTRAEHLLIHRIQSHTNPKRRKGFLKQAGQKSVKEELPKHRKGPKRTEECRLKVKTHIWDHGAERSNRSTRTKKPSGVKTPEGFCIVNGHAIFEIISALSCIVFNRP